MKKIRAEFLEGLLLAFFIVSFALVVPISAVDYKAGVNAGDWVKYGTISITWTGTGTEPSYVTDAKKMDWAKIEVNSVSGATIDMTTTVHYNNGTSYPETSSVDVETGAWISGVSFIIAANLNKGDPITTQPTALTINDTASLLYAGATRTVNIIDVTTVSDSYESRSKIHFDKATGMMLEFFMRYPDYMTTGAYVEYTIKATETNLWSAEPLSIIMDNPYIIVGIIVVIVVIVAVIFIAVRRRPKPPIAATPATTVKESNPDSP